MLTFTVTSDFSDNLGQKYLARFSHPLHLATMLKVTSVFCFLSTLKRGDGGKTGQDFCPRLSEKFKCCVYGTYNRRKQECVVRSSVTLNFWVDVYNNSWKIFRLT